MKQYPLCSDCEDKATPMDLPIPPGLKKEWPLANLGGNFWDARARYLAGRHWQASSVKQVFAIARLRRVPTSKQDLE